MFILAVANSSLVELKSQQEKNHAWYWKHSQLHRHREVMDLGAEPIQLLYYSSMILNYTLSICPYIHR